MRLPRRLLLPTSAAVLLLMSAVSSVTTAAPVRDSGAGGGVPAPAARSDLVRYVKAVAPAYVELRECCSACGGIDIPAEYCPECEDVCARVAQLAARVEAANDRLVAAEVPTGLLEAHAEALHAAVAMHTATDYIVETLNDHRIPPLMKAEEGTLDDPRVDAITTYRERRLDAMMTYFPVAQWTPATADIVARMPAERRTAMREERLAAMTTYVPDPGAPAERAATLLATWRAAVEAEAQRLGIAAQDVWEVAL